MKELKLHPSITPRNSNAINKYFNDIHSTTFLTPDEEVELSLRIKQGDVHARNRLVKANLRFVISVAKQYQNQGIELEDLINEGNIGLIKAAEKFDPTRGFKFISCAVWWIRQSITSALAESSRSIRLPLNVVNSISRLQKAIHTYEQNHSCFPSLEELSQMTDLPIDRIDELLKISQHTVSLDAPLTSDAESSLIDVLEDTNSKGADDQLLNQGIQREIRELISSLSPRDAEIIRRSFGIDGPEVSIDDIALEFNLTRERVRQIREQSIKRLQTRAKRVLSLD